MTINVCDLCYKGNVRPIYGWSLRHNFKEKIAIKEQKIFFFRHAVQNQELIFSVAS